jgi:hypothetical protein
VVASDQHAFGTDWSAEDQAEVQRLCCVAVAAMFGDDAVALVASCSGMERRELIPSRFHHIDCVGHSGAIRLLVAYVLLSKRLANLSRAAS